MTAALPLLTLAALAVAAGLWPALAPAPAPSYQARPRGWYLAQAIARQQQAPPEPPTPPGPLLGRTTHPRAAATWGDVPRAAPARRRPAPGPQHAPWPDPPAPDSRMPVTSEFVVPQHLAEAPPFAPAARTSILQPPAGPPTGNGWPAPQGAPLSTEPPNFPRAQSSDQGIRAPKFWFPPEMPASAPTPTNLAVPPYFNSGARTERQPLMPDLRNFGIPPTSDRESPGQRTALTETFGLQRLRFPKGV